MEIYKIQSIYRQTDSLEGATHHSIQVMGRWITVKILRMHGDTHHATILESIEQSGQREMLCTLAADDEEKTTYPSSEIKISC
jgi:hypothetical protein